MSKAIDEIAAKLRQVFKVQRMQADADKEKFGDWNMRLARLLQDSVAKLYLESAKGAKAKAELAPDFAAIAKERALEVAREVNRVTTEWIREGRDFDSIFGPDRVVRIAVTEATFAKSSGLSVVARASGKKLKWVVGRKPCKFCVRLNGRTRKPGSSFGDYNGTPVLLPPVHPNCYCKVRMV